MIISVGMFISHVDVSDMFVSHVDNMFISHGYFNDIMSKFHRRIVVGSSCDGHNKESWESDQVLFPITLQDKAISNRTYK